VPRHPQRPIPKKKLSEAKPFRYRTLVLYGAWSETHSKAFSFGGEEPIEDAIARLRRNTNSIIRTLAMMTGMMAQGGLLGGDTFALPWDFYTILPRREA
jgi:hypothetical protein